MDRRLNLGFIEGVILMFINLLLKYESENFWDLIIYIQLDMNFLMLILLKILELVWLQLFEYCKFVYNMYSVYVNFFFFFG